MEIAIGEGEYWWSGIVNDGHEMPYTRDTTAFFDMEGGREKDQFTPLMLSSKGRYVWSDGSYSGTVEGGCIRLEGSSEFELGEGYDTLRGAYLAAMRKHFPFCGQMPDAAFWRAPQYNTWIELGTEQKAERILSYGREILANGLVPGIMMIDGGWQEDYGVFEFHGEKIRNPKALVRELHEMGFKVMLWVSPIVSAAGPHYRFLSEKGYLVRDAGGKDAVRKWWSGYSCVLDLTNPEAVCWYHEQLEGLRERYGVDGFKFDAGDRYFYEDNDLTYGRVRAREMTRAYNQTGERYDLNEFRAAWNFGGRKIVARLHDKYHSWDSFGINTLIPHTVLQGLCGYAYCCPDMVGGGIIDCFGHGKGLDEELFVRWAQACALMGMMQLSVAPWRVLGKENAALVAEAVKLHTEFGSYIYGLAQQASRTGEPVIRHMAYEFPEEGLERTGDQFMLGSDILAAPVLEKGASHRKVYFPKGSWMDKEGREISGGCMLEIPVDLSSIPYFRRKGRQI